MNKQNGWKPLNPSNDHVGLLYLPFHQVGKIVFYQDSVLIIWLPLRSDFSVREIDKIKQNHIKFQKNRRQYNVESVTI